MTQQRQTTNAGVLDNFSTRHNPFNLLVHERLILELLSLDADFQTNKYSQNPKLYNSGVRSVYNHFRLFRLGTCHI